MRVENKLAAVDMIIQTKLRVPENWLKLACEENEMLRMPLGFQLDKKSSNQIKLEGQELVWWQKDIGSLWEMLKFRCSVRQNETNKEKSFITGHWSEWF